MGDLDFLVIDMPPGTSDAALTIMQTLQLDGFLVVTTPQELAVLDAKRSINMIRKMNVEILGVVENMSSEIFGTGGGQGPCRGDRRQVPRIDQPEQDLPGAREACRARGCGCAARDGAGAGRDRRPGSGGLVSPLPAPGGHGPRRTGKRELEAATPVPGRHRPGRSDPS